MESIPRPACHAIQFSTIVAGCSAEVRDNVLFLELDVASKRDAIDRAEELGSKIARGLILERGLLFHATVTEITDPEGAKHPLAEHWGRASRPYSLSKMQRALVAAAGYSRLEDPRLGKALIYFEHAQVLMDSAHSHPTLSSKAFLISPAFLSVWKALCVILGEPGTDRDYQRRFTQLGYPKEFWKEKVQPIKSVRDSMDVAHYSVEPDVERKIRDAFWSAERVCRDVIHKYAATIRQ